MSTVQYYYKVQSKKRGQSVWRDEQKRQKTREHGEIVMRNYAAAYPDSDWRLIKRTLVEDEILSTLTERAA